MQPNEPYEPPVRNRRVNRYSSETAASPAAERERAGTEKRENGRAAEERNAVSSGTAGISAGRPSSVRSKAAVSGTRTGKNRKKPFFRSWQWAILLALFVIAVVFACADISAASGQSAVAERLDALRSQREKEKADYAREVASYKTGYRDLVLKYASEYQLRPAFVAAVISCESSYNKDAVSRVDARGLMQIKPDTGAWIAGKLKMKNFSPEDLFDAETNIRLGCWYLNYLSGLFSGDPTVVACAYHAGQGNVRGWVEKYSRDGVTLDLDVLPSSVNDTKTYARRVIRAYAIYQQNYYTD